MRLAILVAVVGCWTAGTPATPVHEPIASAPKPIDEHRHRVTIWQGRYTCSQGPTALTLTLFTVSDGVEATFDFGPLPENPNVPHGSYKLKGKARPYERGEYSLELAPVEWIDRPGAYVMVGLNAITTNEHRGLRGRIAHATCGELELSRLR